MSTVREDDEGIYILLNGAKHRPGSVSGYAHCNRMDSGGLKKGDKVKASHVACTPTIRITLDDGTKLRWHQNGEEFKYYQGQE